MTYVRRAKRAIDDALSYTIANIRDVHRALPKSRIAILEAGWATTSVEFGDRASEAGQACYFEELGAWAKATNTTVFLFEAFDEPWKGDPKNPLGAEKHWGLWFVDRTPKAAIRSKQR